MEKVNIVFATDENYIKHLGVALYSLLVNNKDMDFNVYIINGGISKAGYDKLIAIANNFNCGLISLVVDDDLFEKLVTNHHFTKANYYRLLIPEFIQDKKILYLDADIVVNGSIMDLYNTDIEDYFLAAVEVNGFDRHSELKMDKKSKYFNSGVMLINVEKWKSSNVQKNVIDFVSEYKDVIYYVDQCGLNAVVNGEWKQLPLKFNQQAAIYKDDFDDRYNVYSNEELLIAKNEPVIIHYTGSSKPWHFRNKHPYKHLYWKYLKFTPFKQYVPDDMTLLNVLKYIVPTKIKNTVKNFLH